VNRTPHGPAGGRGAAKRIEIHLLDDRDLPTEGKTYDLIVSHEILEEMGRRYLIADSERVNPLRAKEAIDGVPSIGIPG